MPRLGRYLFVVQMTHDSHPDLLSLDAHRAGEPAPEVAEHLAACGACARHLELQRSLAAELGAPLSIEVPPSQDAALRAAARQHADRAAADAATAPRRWRWVAGAALAIAAAAVLLLMFARGPGEGTGQRLAAAPVHGDINLDGRLDVIDALVLARQLDGGQADPTRADLNGDGRVDHSDVDWISAEVVSPRRVR
ncbi:MAG TPA: dockerin type I repeat-containing protein [Kofleriaceae bacterium]|nr:dockerin type I repeat-containing protein [Kofleriaceae bacterium]